MSVVLPALNEERTVADIVVTLRRLVDELPLIDELVVVDSGSVDRTAEVARAAGAAVVAAESVLPGRGVVPGKADVLWKGLAATGGDLVLFIDADLEGVSAAYVVGLLGPLLLDPAVRLVKAFYDRPLVTDYAIAPSGGGRVTELVARPLLNLYWPELAGVIQPLSGEYGGEREVLESIPFVSGYGVEIGMLIDVVERYGAEAIAQVDLGTRVHRNQPDAALGVMACHVLQAALMRLHRRAGMGPIDASGTLVQFGRAGVDFVPTSHEVAVGERPPLTGLSASERAQARALVAAEIAAGRGGPGIAATKAT